MENKHNLPPTILVIFGITGDLSHRYLLPALVQIEKAGTLPQDFKIIGVSRRQIKTSELFKENENNLQKYAIPLQMDMESRESYKSLQSKLEEIYSSFSTKPEVIFYLSVPPAGVLPIIRHLGESGLNSSNTKLLLEKPFGVDLESAQELINETAKHFPEEQVYRIDHYLAKEMAQNITVFLSSNTLFRNVWSNKFIEKIEIEASEKISIEGRVNFYDSTGALRDLVQSHLLQLAALTLMRPCSSLFEFNELPERRLEALQQLTPVLDKGLVRGQYGGYESEVDNPGSETETFAALTLESSDPRWTGVPIHLSTGKNLKEKLTEIRVYFNKTDETEANLLTLRVQPRESIELVLWVKEPGYERKLQELPLDFTYAQHFEKLPEAYEQVLVDAMKSNQSLFASSKEVLASWKILQPVQSRWEIGKDKLVIYKAGSPVSDVLKLALT